MDTTTDPIPTSSPPPPPAMPLPAPPPAAWYNRPVPAIAAGVALLALCAVFAVLWISTPFFLARALGYLSGGAGILLVWGGVNGLRQERAEREWGA